MFVGCSEISISVIVNHVTCGLLSFSVPERKEKIAGLWFARGISSQPGTIDSKSLAWDQRNCFSLRYA